MSTEVPKKKIVRKQKARRTKSGPRLMLSVSMSTRDYDLVKIVAAVKDQTVSDYVGDLLKNEVSRYSKLISKR